MVEVGKGQRGQRLDEERIKVQDDYRVGMCRIVTTILDIQKHNPAESKMNK